MNNNNTVGFLLVNKPKHISSAACVAYVKRIINKKIKIGHAGTLDPFATGLLIIAIEREATRLLPLLMCLKKGYYANAKLGELTDTLDLTGAIIKESDNCTIKESDMREVIASFGSSYEQAPPIYSALRHQGERLYNLARRDLVPLDELVTITQQKRRIVSIDTLDLVSFSFPFFSIQTTVSHGTYIRSLMNDIASRLTTCATTYELERTSIGPFILANAQPLLDLKIPEDIEKHIISTEILQSALQSYYAQQ